jgi:hypothetical protein
MPNRDQDMTDGVLRLLADQLAERVAEHLAPRVAELVSDGPAAHASPWLTTAQAIEFGALPLATIGLASTTLLLASQCSLQNNAATLSPPSSTAVKTIPSYLLSIYKQVGAQYNLPWQILAGIGQQECDQGRDPDPSCTPQHGATGPGTANYAGPRWTPAGTGPNGFIARHPPGL